MWLLKFHFFFYQTSLIKMFSPFGNMIAEDFLCQMLGTKLGNSLPGNKAKIAYVRPSQILHYGNR